jgi:hypothetical protein
MMALFRIGDAHPHTRSTIADAVKSVLRQEGFSLSISLKPSKDQFFEMADNVRRVAALKLKAWGLAGEAGALDMAEPIGTPAAKEA